MIETFETRNQRAVGEARARGGSLLDAHIVKNWASLDLPPWGDIRDGRFVGTVEAVVNHGRWIVVCPADGCLGAAMAAESDPRFVCVDCGAGPYRVVWPKDRPTIEETLVERPERQHRNWVPGETVAFLRSENRDRLGARDRAGR